MSSPTYFAVIVGAGLSGATLARELADAGKRVLVIDKRAHTGGNVFDEIEPESGLRVARYGAHLFHTNDEGVWAYVRRFARWQRWDHRVVTRVSGRLVPVPANINTVNALFEDANIVDEAGMRAFMAREREGDEKSATNSEEVALARVGRRLYESLFETYTKKQWGVTARELDPLVLQRIPVRENFDDRYFGDRYQALPVDGYAAFVDALLANENITVRLNADFFGERAELERAAEWVLYTGPVDAFFSDAGLPRLEYRSINFESRVIDCVGFAQPNSVVNFGDASVEYTRSIEYKHFLHQTSPTGKTVIVSERSTGDGEPYYPMPTQVNKDLYARYQALAAAAEAEARAPRVRFVGRLATYKYINMDAAIRGGLDAAAEILRTAGGCD